MKLDWAAYEVMSNLLFQLEWANRHAIDRDIPCEDDCAFCGCILANDERERGTCDECGWGT